MEKKTPDGPDETPLPEVDLHQGFLFKANAAFPGDVLGYIFTYMDVKDLITSRLVCRAWMVSSDVNERWKDHCRALWGDKQNHPLERWARIPRDSLSVDDITRLQVEFLLLHQLQRGEETSVEDPRFTDLYTCLNFIAFMSPHRAAAPVSHILRNQQIQLENDLQACADKSEQDRLTEQIITNINSPIEVEATVLKDLDDRGLLLSWRESYVASVVDSLRCRMTYEVK